MYQVMLLEREMPRLMMWSKMVKGWEVLEERVYIPLGPEKPRREPWPPQRMRQATAPEVTSGRPWDLRVEA